MLTMRSGGRDAEEPLPGFTKKAATPTSRTTAPMMNFVRCFSKKLSSSSWGGGVCGARTGRDPE